MVEALRQVPGVHVTVVAPATNQSGVGDRVTPGGVTAFESTTASGYPAVAVQGTPADSGHLRARGPAPQPDLVVSGINLGQNLGPVVALSGTVGGSAPPPDGASRRWPLPGLRLAGRLPQRATAVLQWFDDYRLGRTGSPAQAVSNLNIPTCTTGAIRGTVVVPSATS